MGAPIGIGYGFRLGFLSRVKRVAERLAVTDAGVGELLGYGADLGKILEFQTDAGRDLVADHFVLGVFPIVLRIHGEEADFRRFRIDAVGTQNLTRGLSLLGGLVVGI